MLGHELLGLSKEGLGGGVLQGSKEDEPDRRTLLELAGIASKIGGVRSWILDSVYNMWFSLSILDGR